MDVGTEERQIAASGTLGGCKGTQRCSAAARNEALPSAVIKPQSSQSGVTASPNSRVPHRCLCYYARRGTLADAVLRQRVFHTPLGDGCVGVNLPELLEVGDMPCLRRQLGPASKADSSACSHADCACRDRLSPHPRHTRRLPAIPSLGSRACRPLHVPPGFDRRRGQRALPARPRHRAWRHQAGARLHTLDGGPQSHNCISQHWIPFTQAALPG